MSANAKTEKVNEPEIKGPSMSQHRGPPMMMTEKVKLERSRGTLWRWMFSYIFKNKYKFIFFFALLLIGTIISSISPLFTELIIDRAIVVKNSQLLLMLVFLYSGLLIIMGVTQYISQYGMGKVSQQVVYDIRNQLFSQLQGMSMTYFDQHLSGDIISITTNDIDQLNDLVGGQFAQIITSIVAIGFSITIMYVLNPILATSSLVIFPIFLLLTKRFQKKVTGAFKETRKTISKVTTSIQENIAGAKVVQSYGKEDRASSEFDAANKADYNAGFKARSIFASFFPLVTYITNVLTASILVFGGFLSIGHVSIFGIIITVGVLAAYISTLSQFFRPFMTLTQIQQIIESAMAAADRIYGLVTETVEIPEVENPLPFENIKGEITFENVSFGYNLENGDLKNGNEDKNKQSAPKTFLKSLSIKKSKNRVNKKIEHEKEEILERSSDIPSLNDSSNKLMVDGMRKRIKEVINSFPEPYKTYLKENIASMQNEIKSKLFMNLIDKTLEEVPQTIDAILAEVGHAVAGTIMAKEHPEYKTTFNTELSDKLDASDHSRNDYLQSMESLDPSSKDDYDELPFKIDENMIMGLAKQLERMLKSQINIPQSSSMGGESSSIGGMGSESMKINARPNEIARMMATVHIHPDIYEQLPKIVKDAIKEQKTLIEHEQTKGFVLNNVNLHIPQGKTVAIVGETGAGKTTMIKLISRYYDVNRGSIKIDGIDVRKVKKKDLRDQIGLVPQDAFIFTGTIKENLLYAYDDFTEEIENKMIDVSKFLGLHNFIETLPDKYDTYLMEMGSNISIGQRQLIAFARALITDPKILILDEATSSVDPYTETLIQDALDKAREGRTTIIIAHRLSTIKNADHIVVLNKENKGIIEEGTHEELIKLNGKYNKLLEMQYKDV
jgi:ABC-type multidrug transport system fused ATPase/permease subunit